MIVKKHLVFFGFLFIPIVSYIYLLTEIPSSLIFWLTNFLVLLVSFLGMALVPSKPYSLSKLFFVFIFFFFGIVPLVNEVNQTIFWGGGSLSLFDKALTNILILIGMFSFLIGERLRFKSFEFYLIKRIYKVQVSRIRLSIVLIVFFVILFLILKYSNFNLIQLLFRGAVSDLLGEVSLNPSMSQIEYLLFKNVIRPMPIIFLFLFYYLFLKSKDINIRPSTRISPLVMVSVFFLSVFFLSPTSVSRYMVAALYLPFIFIFTNLWEHKYRMQIYLVGFLVFMMPILDNFRNFDPSNLKFEVGLNYLNQEHFDAYQNFVRVVSENFVTNGLQFLGALLFFVPRSVWPEKPIGSGAQLANDLNYEFANISMPYMAEGYVSFGVAGVILLMILMGFIVGYFDRIAWSVRHLNKSKHHVFIYYYFINFGMLFFMLRGDLMSSFAYTVGISISFVIVFLIFKLSALRLKF
ncbi:MAG: hypothetical protein COW40_00125 [Cytophagales bacterium CG17_big_fil_post_rev_8_21_14_2_50_40_13]|nr:MAG: hypothetical protein COW40_00125 [Cytophagales bacterium CG17_big_fil_post_rev_8_21_14_2_50_40_13]